MRHSNYLRLFGTHRCYPLNYLTNFKKNKNEKFFISENVGGRNANSQTNSFNEDSHNANKLVENIIPWRIWLKVSTSFNDPWNQLRYIKWMNKRADGRTAYVPTEVINDTI